MLYELAVVGDLPLPSYSHASVIRSSNQKTMKAAMKASSNPMLEQRRFMTNPPSQPSADFRENNGNPSSVARSQSLSPAATDRSAINQALYPRHAHLFGPRTDDSTFNWDLSPSVFTRTTSASSSQQPDSTPGECGDASAQSVFARGSERVIESMSRSGSELGSTPSIQGSDNPAYGHLNSASPATSVSTATSSNADWAPLGTATQYASSATARGLCQGIQSVPVFYHNLETYAPPTYNAPSTSQASDTSRDLPEPPRTLQSFSDPMSNHHENAAAYLTATGYVNGMMEDTTLNHETLAMWSNVPVDFKYVIRVMVVLLDAQLYV